MTAPEPVSLDAPADPAAHGPNPDGPGSDGRGARLFSVGFWVMLGFTVLCLFAGFVIWRVGPQLFPVVKPPAATPAQVPIASLDARLADIQARLDVGPAAPAAPAQAAAEITALSQRVDRLEADRRQVTLAAAGALAAASLSEAAETSRPFAGELAALEGSLPESADLRALRPLAETGAPTVAALAAEYPDAAARAAVASRAHAQGEGGIARIAQAFAAIVTIRRVDQVEGPGVDAVLARAERRVDAGDLSGAIGELSGLPPAGQDAMAAWRVRAQRRAEIDRRVAAVRAAALADLGRMSREGTGG